MLKVYLIRHGETDFNREKRIQGTINTELNEKGKYQAQLLGKSLIKELEKVDYIFSSPQPRAKQTAEILGEIFQENHIPVSHFEIVTILREISCGRWEGKLFEEIQREEPELYSEVRTKVDVPYPGGESILDVRKRGEEFLKNYLYPLQDSETVLVVSHGTFLRTMSTALLQIPADFVFKIVLNNTGTSLFEEKKNQENRTQKTFRMIYWNSVKHLQV